MHLTRLPPTTRAVISVAFKLSPGLPDKMSADPGWAAAKGLEPLLKGAE